MKKKRDAIQLNEYISIRLDDERTIIYLNGKKFDHCRIFPIVIPKRDVEDYDDIQSLEEAADVMKGKVNGDDKFTFDISPEERFKVHWSNIQAWVESGYNTLLLHSNLSFPLLKKLYKLGDPQAKKVYKEEIASRMASGNETVIRVIFARKMYKALSDEDMDAVIFDLEHNRHIKRELPNIFKIMAEYYHKHNQHAKAIILLEKSIHLDDTDPDAWKTYVSLWARTYLFIDKFPSLEPATRLVRQKAEECLEEVLALGPDPVASYILNYIKENKKV